MFRREGEGAVSKYCRGLSVRTRYAEEVRNFSTIIWVTFHMELRVQHQNSLESGIILLPIPIKFAFNDRGILPTKDQSENHSHPSLLGSTPPYQYHMIVVNRKRKGRILKVQALLQVSNGLKSGVARISIVGKGVCEEGVT